MAILPPRMTTWCDSTPRTAAGVEREVVVGPLIVPARRHDPGVVALEVAFLRLGYGRLIPQVALVDRVAQWVLPDERLAFLPVLVVRAAQQDADAEVDLNQVGGDELAVDHDPGRDVHRPARLGHVLIRVVADIRVLERAPATQQDTSPANLLVAGKRLVEEVEQVVVKRYDLLHELDVLHEADKVVGQELDGGNSADSSWVER